MVFVGNDSESLKCHFYKMSPRYNAKLRSKTACCEGVQGSGRKASFGSQTWGLIEDG